MYLQIRENDTAWILVGMLLEKDEADPHATNVEFDQENKTSEVWVCRLLPVCPGPGERYRDRTLLAVLYEGLLPVYPGPGERYLREHHHSIPGNREADILEEETIDLVDRTPSRIIGFV